jgi:histidyl-tRNA synthetase
VTNDEAKEGIQELEELFSYFSGDELWNVMFNPYLARGLSYYTGTVFEGFLRDSDITSSICGGGRYDNLVKMLLSSKNDVPAVGISFGLVPIMEAIKKSKTILKKSVTRVYVIPIGDTSKEALEVASKLREKNIKTDIDLMRRNISKNLSFANANEIPYVLFIGEDELKKGRLKLRDMASGKESFVSLKEVEKEVKKIVS